MSAFSSLTSVWIIEPLHESENGGFATSTGSDQGYRLGCRDGEVEVLKDHCLRARRVRKFDSFDINPAPNG